MKSADTPDTATIGKFKFMAALYLALIAVIIFWASVIGIPEFIKDIGRKVHGFDKAMHFLLIGLAGMSVTLLSNYASCRIGRLVVLWGAVAVCLIMVFEELSQMFIPTRSFSCYDMLANLVGILFFSYLLYYFHDRRKTASVIKS